MAVYYKISSLEDSLALEDNMPKVLVDNCAPYTQPLDLAGLDPDLSEVNVKLTVAGVPLLNGLTAGASWEGHQDPSVGTIVK